MCLLYSASSHHTAHQISHFWQKEVDKIQAMFEFDNNIQLTIIFIAADMKVAPTAQQKMYERLDSKDSRLKLSSNTQVVFLHKDEELLGKGISSLPNFATLTLAYNQS